MSLNVSQEKLLQIQAQIEQELTTSNKDELTDKSLIQYGQALSTRKEKIGLIFKAIWRKIRHGESFAAIRSNYFKAHTYTAIKKLNKSVIEKQIEGIFRAETKELLKAQAIKPNQVILKNSPLLQELKALHKFYQIKTATDRQDNIHWLTPFIHSEDLGENLHKIDPFSADVKVLETVREKAKKLVRLDNLKTLNKDISNDDFIALLKDLTQKEKLIDIIDDENFDTIVNNFNFCLELYKGLSSASKVKDTQKLFIMLQDLNQKKKQNITEKKNQFFEIYNNQPLSDKRLETSQKLLLIFQDIDSSEEAAEKKEAFKAFLNKHEVFRNALLAVSSVTVEEKSESKNLFEIQELAEKFSERNLPADIAFCQSLEDIKNLLTRRLSTGVELKDIFGEEFAQKFDQLSSAEQSTAQSFILDLKKLKHNFELCGKQDLFQEIVIKRLINKPFKTSDKLISRLADLNKKSSKVKAINEVSQRLTYYIELGINGPLLQPLRDKLLQVIWPQQDETVALDTEMRRTTLASVAKQAQTKLQTTATRLKDTVQHRASFERPFSQILTDFNKEQFNQVVNQWKNRYGQILANQLIQLLGSEVEKGQLHYKDQKSPYSTSNFEQKLLILDSAYQQFQTKELTENFQALISSHLSVDPQNAEDVFNSIDKIFQHIETLKPHLDTLKKLNGTGLGKVYQERLHKALATHQANASEFAQEMAHYEKIAELINTIPPFYKKGLGTYLINYLTSEEGKEELNQLDSLPQRYDQLNQAIQHFVNEGLGDKAILEQEAAQMLETFIAESSAENKAWFLLDSKSEALLHFSRKLNQAINKQIFESLKSTHGTTFSQLVKEYVDSNPDLSAGKISLKQSEFYKKSFVDQVNDNFILSLISARIRGTQNRSILDDQLIKASLSKGLTTDNFETRFHNLQILNQHLISKKDNSEIIDIKKELIRALNTNPFYLLDLDKKIDPDQKSAKKELKQVQENFEKVVNFCVKRNKALKYTPAILAQGIVKLIEDEEQAKSLPYNKQLEILAKKLEKKSKTSTEEFKKHCQQIKADLNKPITMDEIINKLETNSFSFLENFAQYLIDNLIPEKHHVRANELHKALADQHVAFNQSKQVQFVSRQVVAPAIQSAVNARKLTNQVIKKQVDVKSLVAEQIKALENLNLRQELQNKNIQNLDQLNPEALEVTLESIFKDKGLDIMYIGLWKVVSVASMTHFKHQTNGMDENDLFMDLFYNVLPNDIIKNKKTILGLTKNWGFQIATTLQTILGKSKFAVKIGNWAIETFLKSKIEKIKFLEPETRELVLSILEPLSALVVLALPTVLSNHGIEKYMSFFEFLNETMKKDKITNSDKVDLLIQIVEFSQQLTQDFSNYVPAKENMTQTSSKQMEEAVLANQT